MSSAQDRPPGVPGEPPQEGTGAPVTGTTGGAPGSSATTGATSTGTTTAGSRDRSDMVQEQQSPAARYDRGTAPTAYQPTEEAEATGGTIFGGVFLIMAGLLTFFAGLSAIVRSHYYHVATNYAYAWNVRDWGWVLFGLGIAMFAIGACCLFNMVWARAVGVGLSVLTAIAGFMWLVYAPVWGVILVALSVVAIWGLLSGGERQEAI